MLGFTYDQICNVYNNAKKLAQDNCEKNITFSKDDLYKVALSYKELSAFFIESYHASFKEVKAIFDARNRIIDMAEKLGLTAAQKGYSKESAELSTLKEPLNISYQLFCDAFNEGFDNQKLGSPSKSLLGKKHIKSSLNKISKSELKESYGTKSPKAIPTKTKASEMPSLKQPKSK